MYALRKLFVSLNNRDQGIKFTMEGEIHGELAFLDTLLKWNNGKISGLVYRKPSYTNTYTTALITKQVARKVVFPRL